ncbi:MAG: hypothetical protein R3D29_14715 [Nitratireductor sp.]
MTACKTTSPYHAARADFLARAGEPWLAAYDKAIRSFTQNRHDRLFLENRKRKLQAG